MILLRLTTPFGLMGATEDVFCEAPRSDSEVREAE